MGVRCWATVAKFGASVTFLEAEQEGLRGPTSYGTTLERIRLRVGFCKSSPRNHATNLRVLVRQPRAVGDLNPCSPVGPKPFYESEPHAPPSLTRTQLGPNHAFLFVLIRKHRLGRRAESHGS